MRSPGGHQGGISGELAHRAALYMLVRLSMSSSNVSTTGRPRRFPRRLALVAALALLAAGWFLHPPVLERLTRYGLTREAARAGLQLEIGDIQAHLARPLVASKIRLRAKDSRVSRTAAEIDRVVLTLNWPWRAFFGERRLIRFAAVENLRGVFDFASSAPAKPSGPPTSASAPKSASPSSLLPFFPETVRVSRASFEILARRQSYFVEDLSAEFSEEALGTFSASAAEIHAGSIGENFGALKGVTAWKDGTVYLADLVLREGIRIDNFQAELARPGQLALTVEAEIFGGAMRGDLTLGSREAPATISVWAAGTQLQPLIKLLGWGGDTDGVLREARFTFRGDPARALDGQASLRLSAEEFRWKGRGWESLQVGANLSSRRLSVSDFTFRQKENTLAVNGDLMLTEKWSDISRAQFLLNVTASVKNLGELAGLFGPPFHEMSGRMSLSSSINGRLGAINGFLSAEGSEMGFRDRPIESGRVEMVFANSEAQVTQCELWNGRDYVRGKGSVQLMPPHQYSGDVQARVEDVAAYLGLLRTKNILPIQSGIAQIRWQGDGTATAHSGAFQIALDKFVSSLTPSGLTGRFAGTYSPQNIYFSGFELEQGQLRFSTRATLAGSGVKLQDSVLLARGREIADAEIFLPLNPFGIAAGKPLNSAVLADKPLYANVATRGALGVRDLLRLAGNDLPAVGTVRVNLQASGNPASPVIEGKIEGRGLGLETEGGKIPPSQLDATVRATDGLARVTGEWKIPGSPASTLTLETPLAFRTKDGGVSWWNADDKISAEVAFPRFDLSLLRPLFPRVHRLAGILAGKIRVAGTAVKPEFVGEFSLTDGRLQAAEKSPVIDHVAATARATASALTIEKLTGDVGGGPFEARGEISLAEPAYKLTFSGTKILLASEPGLKLPANIDLEASGTAQNGLVQGSVRFTEAEFSKKLEVTPVLLPAALKDETVLPPRFTGRVPQPFAAWKLDVAVKNDTRFSLGGASSSGELIPDLRLIGTLGQPVPVGRISLVEARAYFPFTTVVIPKAEISFLENAPWIPQLDLRGTARALDYEVQAYAFGPLTERRLILRSDPALPQAGLVTMLATGLTAGVFSQQTSPLTVRPFARQLELSEPGRLEISADGESAAPRGRVQLWQALSLENDGTGFGLLGPRLSYLFRFQ